MQIDIQAIVAQWGQSIVNFLPNALFILVVVVLSVTISRRTQSVVRHLFDRTDVPHEIRELIGRLARIGVLLFGAIMVLARLQLEQAAWTFVTGLGVAGIVIGFALQDIVKHFAAGVLLLVLRPLRIGDRVKIGAFEGTVVDIHLRATLLKTDEGHAVLIPNADVYNTAITNFSHYNVRRRSLTLQIPAAQADRETYQAIIAAVLAVPDVVDTPAPELLTTGVDAANVPTELRYWVAASHTQSDLVASQVVAAARQVINSGAPAVEQRPGAA